MNDLLHRAKHNTGIYIIPAVVAVLIALGLYAYLGIFSRYTSDDYCLSSFFLNDADFVRNMITRYETSSSRYTNILFIGFVDQVFGWYNPAVLPALMLALFVLGFYLVIDQIQGLLHLEWKTWFSFYLAALIAYFSLVQAPDLYETLYWRAGMTSHFAPVALLPFLGAFVLKQIRISSERTPPAWVYAICFTVAFVIGGFSEPPTTVMISALVMAVFAAWWWIDPSSRRSILLVLSSTLAGFLAALIVLALAPANELRLGNTETNLLILSWKILYSTVEFLSDHMRTIPVPALLSVLLPGILFYALYVGSDEMRSKIDQRQLLVLIPVILLVGYVLITASFAPSVYGQGFPAARARFTGVVLLTCTSMAMGALMGILAAKSRWMLFQSNALKTSAIVLFVLLSLYPLRTAWRMTADLPLYEQRAADWDERDARIQSLKEDGIQDLTIRFLSNDPVQDLGDRTEFRLNRCAAKLYGVNSIITLPMK